MAKKLSDMDIKQQQYSEFSKQSAKQRSEYMRVILKEIKRISDTEFGLDKWNKLTRLYGEVWKHERLEGFPVDEKIIEAMQRANGGKKLELPDELKVASGFTIGKYSKLPQIKAKQYDANKKKLNEVIRYGNMSETELILKYKSLLDAAIKTGEPIDKNKLSALRNRKLEIENIAFQQANDPTHPHPISVEQYRALSDRLSFTVINPTKKLLSQYDYKNTMEDRSKYYQDELDCLNHIYQAKKQKHSMFVGETAVNNIEFYREEIEGLKIEKRTKGKYSQLLNDELNELLTKQSERDLEKVKAAREKEARDKRDFLERMSRSSVGAKFSYKTSSEMDFDTSTMEGLREYEDAKERAFLEKADAENKERIKNAPDEVAEKREQERAELRRSAEIYNPNYREDDGMEL